ncbi:peptidoglycan-binding domain-containing protein [Catellatospora sp. NPDC049133]|uniref:peptidoglycan-binding domain-containing protein n=1 Tax=Catellatospora sp. NPDC049133 TaxID=3155499 RepID=UPI0033E77694
MKLESGKPHPRRWGARVLAVGAALAAAIAVSLAAAAPAQAATPTCNGTGAYYRNGGDTATFVATYTANGSETWRCSMRYGLGTTGKFSYAVLQLQDSLNLCYGKVIGGRIGADGEFGTQTKNALVKVQRALGITADGVYGPQTAAAMQHWSWSYTPYGLYYVCLRLP